MAKPNKKNLKRKKVDWINLEKEYRVGQLSIRALGRKYTVADSTLRDRIAKEGWKRDLKKTFDKALDDAVVRETAQKTTESAHCAVSDDEVVEAAVGTSIEVIKKHRGYIHKLHELADNASGCIEGIFEDKSFDKFEWLLGSGKESVMTMLQKLTTVREKAIVLERQAYNLDKKEDEQDDKPTSLNIINYADADDSL